MDLILPVIFPIKPIDGSPYYGVIDSSNIQFFSSVSTFLSCNEGKILELRKEKKINIDNLLEISKFCVMRLIQKQKNQ